VISIFRPYFGSVGDRKPEIKFGRPYQVYPGPDLAKSSFSQSRRWPIGRVKLKIWCVAFWPLFRFSSWLPSGKLRTSIAASFLNKQTNSRKHRRWPNQLKIHVREDDPSNVLISNSRHLGPALMTVNQSPRLTKRDGRAKGRAPNCCRSVRPYDRSSGQYRIKYVVK
jgi:hypothetical protein